MLHVIKIDPSIRSQLTKPIDSSLIKEREGGKTILRYVSGATVINLLNQVFNYAWSWTDTEQWIQPSIPFFNKYAKYDDTTMFQGNKGIFEEQPPVAHVKGKLTVYLTDENNNVFKVEKTGYGSKTIIGKVSEQESIFKAASTDALKKAASMLGIAIDLYMDEEEQAYFFAKTLADSWTDEMKDQYAEELAYILNVMHEFAMSDEDLDKAVLEFSGGALHSFDEITPDNIKDFVKWMQEVISDSVGEE